MARSIFALAVLLAVVPLAGCAKTTVGSLAIASAPIRQSAPTSLAIVVTVAPELGADDNAVSAAHRLREALLARYRKAGLPVSVASPAAPVLSSAMVRVEISRADPGSRLERMLIGFGAGRSALRTETCLVLAGSSNVAMAFSTTTKSGRKPGLVLPGVVAAGTGELIGLAVGGGTGLLAEAGGGLDRSAKRAANTIVSQTRDFYRSAGWPWPSDSSAARRN